MEFSTEDLLQYEGLVTYLESHPDQYTDIETSECYGRLGIAYFYTGSYAKAISQFDKCFGCRHMIKTDKMVAQIYVLLGISSYRLGDLERAERSFEMATTFRKIDEEICCMAMCNYALTKFQLHDSKKAILKAHEAIKFASTIYLNETSKEV
jgi:tetratricopeptide (TPR) repeat protein